MNDVVFGDYGFLTYTASAAGQGELSKLVRLGGAAQILDQRLEILIDRDRLDVIGRIETPVHLRDRKHAAGGVG